MEDKIQSFLDKIDKWIDNQDVLPVSFNKNEVIDILNLESSDLKRKSIDDLTLICFSLNSYLHHLQQLENREDCVFNFADSSIWYIISPILNTMPNDYSKGQKRNYNLAIGKNEFAKRLLELKNISESRLKILSNQIDIIDKKIEIITSLLKRKQYESSRNS